MNRPRPELLAPAGSPEALRAAVQNGADAVYLGWGGFHARSRAAFSDTEFRDAVRYCRRRGVRVYLTLNTLLTDRELPLALEQARTAFRLGVSAVLVQDWGLFDLLRHALPDLPVHASTQMSVFTSAAVRLLHADGCSRVVIARECSREDTAALVRDGGAEIEAFAHGALCVSCSGQCFFSAVIGGRSANRGRCAQPCRMPCRGAYPLSLKDLSLAGRLRELRNAGVACIKLEGRARRPEYVAVVTGIYARLLRENRPPTGAEERDLAAAFSRSGFTDGYWTGHTGPAMFGARPETRTEPENLFRRARISYQDDSARKTDADFSLTLRRGKPCILRASRGSHAVTLTGPVPEPARARAVTPAELESRLRKTGGSVYRAGSVSVQADDGLSLPARTVNQMRRAALDALDALRTAPVYGRENEPPPLPDTDCSAPEPRFTISALRLDQIVPDTLKLSPAWIALPLEELARADRLPELPDGTVWCAIPPRVWRDRDEESLRRAVETIRRPGVVGALAGNLGHIPLLENTGLALYGDYGLNVFNARALNYLREKGLRSACLSFELRMEAVRDMPKILPAEAIVYGRLPLMITENRPRVDGNALRDRTGAAFPLLDAFGGRTEIENSRPLWLADRTHWRNAGLAFARLRFTVESPAECGRVCRAYQDREAPVGAFTRGLYERGVD